METETIKQEGAQEKTFTQAEVNAIVKERLDRQSQKYADYETLKEKASKFDEFEEKNKSELEKATERANSLQAELDSIRKASELTEMRTKIATENNVPINLLTGSTEEECNEQVKNIKEFLSTNGIPVTVRDGGEVSRTGKLDPGTVFEQWAKDKL